MDDRELSRMVSLEGIAQRYADEAASLRSTLAACNEVAATYKAELQRYRAREPLVRELRMISDRAVYELGGTLLRTDLTQALNRIEDFGRCDSSATETTESAAESSGSETKT